MLTPACFLLGVAVPRRLWMLAPSLVCSIAGAFPAAFALRQQRKGAIRQALPSFIAAAAVGSTLCALLALAQGRSIGVISTRLPLLFGQFLIMFPLGFTVEEVVFRGALDTHVTQGPNSPARKWGSAIFVSILWGLWHLPETSIVWSSLHLPDVSSGQRLGLAAAGFVVIGILVGVPLSFCWRKSRTLVLPAAAHALMDAFRNSLLF